MTRKTTIRLTAAAAALLLTIGCISRPQPEPVPRVETQSKEPAKSWKDKHGPVKGSRLITRTKDDGLYMTWRCACGSDQMQHNSSFGTVFFRNSGSALAFHKKLRAAGGRAMTLQELLEIGKAAREISMSDWSPDPWPYDDNALLRRFYYLGYVKGWNQSIRRAPGTPRPDDDMTDEERAVWDRGVKDGMTTGLKALADWKQKSEAKKP